MSGTFCEICEVEGPDVDEGGVCPDCRAFIDATSSQYSDPVEVVLSRHWTMTPLCTPDHQLCRCGWSIDSGPAYHRRHVAEMIYEALGLPGPVPWDDGPLVEHPQPTTSGMYLGEPAVKPT